MIGLHPDDIKAVIRRYHEQLTSFREALNGLNVYPVPDGDTGTNMTLTVGSVVESVSAAGTMPEVADAIAHGSLMGARGNSGVILSQILRGLADTFRDCEKVGALDLVSGLDRASAAAYRAVQRPVEGTILTVLRESAEAARDHGSGLGDDLPGLLRRVYERAVEALERTPDMLPVLRQAGVVDAGGAGFLLLLASFLEVVTGVEVALPERVLRAHANISAIEPPDSGVADLRYEVMFLLAADDAGVDRLRDRWSELGDSIVVVGGDGTWSCHIHTDLIGPSVEAAIAVGTPRDIRVTDLLELAGDHTSHGAGFDPIPEVVPAEVGVVAVVVGDGLVEVFRQLGAQGIVTGGQTMNPSTEDLLGVVDSIPAPRVVVLPNNKNIVPVAEQLDTLTTKAVEVVPTRSVAQGIAAMIGYNPLESDMVVLVEDMAAAASAVITGEVTRAVRDAVVEFGRIRHGDWLGIADGTIVVADTDMETVLRGLVATLLMPGMELLTVYTGDGASPATLKALEAWLGEIRPEIEISEVHGGQPLYPYLVSLE